MIFFIEIKPFPVGEIRGDVGDYEICHTTQTSCTFRGEIP